MNLHASSQPAPAAARVAGITRLVRQVCLFREQGEAAQAAHLQEHELAAAVRDLRRAHGPEALPDAELTGLFAAEERRVAEAVILSELLIPRLVGNRPAGAPARPADRPPPGRMPAPAAGAPARAAGPPAIPDLLDAMLAAERPGRSAPPAKPRES